MTRVARALRRRCEAILAAAAVCAPALAQLLRRPPRSTGLRVSYGHRQIPARNAVAHGGMIKIQTLNAVFPGDDRFHLAYLVSSALPPGAVAFARLAQSSGARLVLNQNGVASPAWPGEGWERINRPLASLLHAADHVFYQSEFCREAADRFLGPRRGPSEILYNAVDTDVFSPAPSEPPSRPLTLLLGGNQDERYRLVAALEATAWLARAGESVRLLVTGRLRWAGDEASAKAEADALVRSLELGERVSFLGPYTQAEAPGILRRAHLLLHTKRDDPCPGLVVEAMACGLPIVYSSSGGVPELVGGEAGLGVAAERSSGGHAAPDPEALADAVRAVARDRPRFGAAARRRAVERFDLRPWLERHRQVFAALAGSGGPP